MARTGHVKKMARRPDAETFTRTARCESMQTRYVRGLTIRPLRNGDTATVAAVFARLGSTSRERRFCGAKPRLTDGELAALARVDGSHHVLVAYVDGVSAPAGIARLARVGATGEIAFEVADELQGRGIGSVLAQELAADARAAGITQLVATVCGDNVPVVSLLRRVARSLDVRWHGGERELVLSLVEPAASAT
jgi:GNAT superfamily N-acetyltransferase